MKKNKFKEIHTLRWRLRWLWNSVKSSKTFAQSFDKGIIEDILFSKIYAVSELWVCEDLLLLLMFVCFFTNNWVCSIVFIASHCTWCHNWFLLFFCLESAIPSEVVAAVDVNTTANEIYKHNFPNTPLLPKTIEVSSC